MTTDTPSRFGRIAIAALAVLAVVAGGTAVTAQEADGGQPTVELVPVAPNADGTSDTFEVVASNVSGVGAYEYTVSVESDEPGTITNLTPGGNPPSYFTTVEYSDDNRTAFVRVVGADGNDSGPVSLGTVEFTEEVEREDLSLTVAALGDEDGDSYDVRVPEPSESAYYQVDFVGGAPITELSENTTYSKQNRLIGYLHGSTEESVTRVNWGTANDELRQCVRVVDGGIGDDYATVEFVVAQGCDVDLSLVSYETPGAGWNASTASEQVLFDDAQGTFGPGTHTLTVELPGDPGAMMYDTGTTDASGNDSDAEDTESSASLDATAVRGGLA